jgi:hypothetical protein
MSESGHWRGEAEFDIFTEGDTLTAGDLLPGFAVLVGSLFEE